MFAMTENCLLVKVCFCCLQVFEFGDMCMLGTEHHGVQ